MKALPNKYSSQSESFSERNFIGLCPKKGEIK